MGHTAHGLHPEPAGAWSTGEQAGWALQRLEGLGGSQEEARASQERGDSSHAGVQTDALLPRVGQIWTAVLAPLPLHLDGGAGGWGGRPVALTDCIRQTVIDPAGVYPWCLISINSSLKELAGDSALPSPVPSSSSGLSGMEDL